MKSIICLFACVAFASAQVLLHDDGQWKPHLDGSILGQWNPLLDNSLAGQPLLTRAALLGHPLVHVLRKRNVLGTPLVTHGVPTYAAVHGQPLVHLLKKRDVLATPWAAHGLLAAHHGLVNPNALNVPLDTVHVAAAKNAQLISQATEGARNVLGGGVPVHLPADTPEVAIGKAAHAVAHETQKALTTGVWAGHGLVGGVAAPGVVAGRALLGHGLVAPHGVLGARSWLW
uniref:5-3 exoribonuclease 2-like protein n=1 Tax=Triatoma infestans TaxID=30076 RepID=A0A171B914_TRIIF